MGFRELGRGREDCVVAPGTPARFRPDDIRWLDAVRAEAVLEGPAQQTQDSQLLPSVSQIIGASPARPNHPPPPSFPTMHTHHTRANPHPSARPWYPHGELLLDVSGGEGNYSTSDAKRHHGHSRTSALLGPKETRPTSEAF